MPVFEMLGGLMILTTATSMFASCIYYGFNMATSATKLVQQWTIQKREQSSVYHRVTQSIRHMLGFKSKQEPQTYYFYLWLSGDNSHQSTIKNSSDSLTLVVTFSVITILMLCLLKSIHRRYLRRHSINHIDTPTLDQSSAEVSTTSQSNQSIAELQPIKARYSCSCTTMPTVARNSSCATTPLYNIGDESRQSYLGGSKSHQHLRRRAAGSNEELKNWGTSSFEDCCNNYSGQIGVPLSQTQEELMAKSAGAAGNDTEVDVNSRKRTQPADTKFLCAKQSSAANKLKPSPKVSAAAQRRCTSQAVKQTANTARKPAMKNWHY